MTSVHAGPDNNESGPPEAPAVQLAGFRFAMMPEALLVDRRVSDKAVRVFGILLRHGSDPSSCYPSWERLGEMAHASRTTVYRALDELEETGWMQRVQRFRADGGQSSNGYVLYQTPGVTSDTGGGSTDETGGGSTRETGGGSTDETRTRARKNESQKERDTPPTPPMGGTTDGALFDPSSVPTPLTEIRRAQEGSQWLRSAFDAWWSKYPRKGRGGPGDKRRAWTEYQKQIKGGASRAELDRQLAHYNAARARYEEVAGELCWLMAAPKFLRELRHDLDEPWDDEQIFGRWSSDRAPSASGKHIPEMPYVVNVARLGYRWRASKSAEERTQILEHAQTIALEKGVAS